MKALPSRRPSFLALLVNLAAYLAALLAGLLTRPDAEA